MLSKGNEYGVGSGSIDYYLSDELIESYVWDSQGNGTYTFYIDGEPYITENWTV